jgi:hypothetical protein
MFPCTEGGENGEAGGGWRYVLSRGSIHDRRNDLAVSKTEFDLNSTERRGEPTEDPGIQITQTKSDGFYS